MLKEVRIFNTMSRQKEVLQTLEKGKVNIYSCGPTVYDFFHLGNARPFVVFDVFRRLLKHVGYEVKFVQNFTDIDDKVINRANAEGVGFEEIAARYIKEYFVDADKLGIQRADVHPKATDSMQAILYMVEQLVNKGHAYLAEDGVYFDVASYKDYGKLSHYRLDELQEGASERVDNQVTKRNPADFALWKFKKKGEPFWQSPWGEGRPGWHIECSAMIYEHLGGVIDIHCGGQDLIFPHHENEIAQSECACCKPFARYWLHNGFINVNYEKMSKSKKNFFTVRTLTERFSYENLRYFILTAHYRSPINFSDDLLEAAGNAWARLKSLKEEFSFLLSKTKQASEVLSNASEVEKYLQNLEIAEEEKQGLQKSYAAVLNALLDDMNTPEALGAIFDYVRDWNTQIAEFKQKEANLLPEEKEAKEKTLLAAQHLFDVFLSLLGISFAKEEISQEVLDLVEKRTKAKKEKNFALADELRTEIAALGYQVMDTAQGVRITKI